MHQVVTELGRLVATPGADVALTADAAQPSDPYREERRIVLVAPFQSAGRV